MESQIRVLLAEDHPIVQEDVRDICAFAEDIELVGIVENSTRVSSVYEKLEVTSRAEAILWWLKEQTPQNKLF